MNVSIIGLGAMGSQMAPSLLRSPAISTVSAYDLNHSAMDEFYSLAMSTGKAHPASFGEYDENDKHRIENFVDASTDVVILMLVNESQCQHVCFDSDSALLTLMKPGAFVVVSSTVSPSWAKSASQRFESSHIRFCDAPVSGGTKRASIGALTIVASSDHADALTYLDAVFRTLGKEIHIISGGVGAAATVKIVHQLLAGCHIVVAAEALALASKAGLDVRQFHEIVVGAAGNSWMFQDRGLRMMNPEGEVMSALDIFVKDLDLVVKEAKRCGVPIPMAAMAMQQFIGGVGLGLGREDDSSVVKVYEALAGVSVKDCAVGAAGADDAIDSTEEDDVWVFPNGTSERILEVGQEVRHNIVLNNEYTRVLKVQFPPNDTTWAHRHTEDSLYFFLVPGGLNVINHIKGCDPACDCMEFGEVRYGTHKSDKPLVHKITNTSQTDMLCIDAEILKSPPVTSPLPLMADHHILIKTRDRCRVYKLVLEPGETVGVTYPFFYLSVVLRSSRVKISIGDVGHPITWEKDAGIGDEEWCSPTGNITVANIGNQTYEQFIAEWR